MNMSPLRTCTVIRLEDDVECVINESDFDPSLHELVEEVKKPRAPKREQVDKSGFGKQTEEELAVMTVDALKQLPEWQHVPEATREAATKKAQIIAAILAVRAQ